MNQFEKQLSDRINNNVPEHQDRFWEDLEQQMSTHVPVEVTEEGAESVAPTVDSHQDHSNVRSLASHRGTSNVGMNNAEMSDIEVGNIEVGNAAVRPASSQSGGKYGRSLAFLASAACVVVALGFAASTIRPTTSETAFAGSTATEYRPIGLKTELDDATKPAPVELSDDKKERLSIDPARIDGFDSGALLTTIIE